jgi:hypothetical protein
LLPLLLPAAGGCLRLYICATLAHKQWLCQLIHCVLLRVGDMVRHPPAPPPAPWQRPPPLLLLLLLLLASFLLYSVLTESDAPAPLLLLLLLLWRRIVQLLRVCGPWLVAMLLWRVICWPASEAQHSIAQHKPHASVGLAHSLLARSALCLGTLAVLDVCVVGGGHVVESRLLACRRSAARHSTNSTRQLV